MNKEDKKYITGKFKASENRLEEKIRHNGVMIERIQDLVYSIADNQQLTNQRLDNLIARFDNVDVDKIPVAWIKLQEHEIRIKQLEEAKAA